MHKVRFYAFRFALIFKSLLIASSSENTIMKVWQLQLLALFLLILFKLSQAQSPVPLVSGLQIDSVMVTHSNVTRISLDPISGNLYYASGNGDIYEVRMQQGQAATDTLRFSFGDHTIEQLQGMCFVDSTLFISGNTGVALPGRTYGIVMRGDLQANGNRNWTVVASTQSHPRGIHPFTSIIADPSGDFLYWASGARTMLGEVSEDGGLFPGYREGPLNSKIYRFPIQSTNILLPNDSAQLDSSGFVYVRGVRNAYSMAFDGQGELFSIDNSGERDDPDELNWIRQGYHYGFPWRMGGNWNPLMNPNYDVNLDPMVNHNSGGYIQGVFAADPNFPSPSSGTIFGEPALNFGPDGDKYRDSLTGNVRDASDDGILLQSFTAHRSPLGLTIDRDSIFGAQFLGRAFVLSYMPGGDSSGMSPLSPWGSPGPFVDPCQDMLMLNLGFDSGYDNYTFTSDRIVSGFYLPVDAVQVENAIYVIEQRGGGRSNLWKVSFPQRPYSIDAENSLIGAKASLFPNPSQSLANLNIILESNSVVKVEIFDLQGRLMRNFDEFRLGKGKHQIPLDVSSLTAAVYLLKVSIGTQTKMLRLLKS